MVVAVTYIARLGGSAGIRKMSYIDTTTVTLDCGALGKLDVEVEFEYEYDAGQYSGAPENCYPSSEDCTILNAWIEFSSGKVLVDIDDINAENRVAEVAAEMYAERMKADREERDYDTYQERALYREYE